MERRLESLEDTVKEQQAHMVEMHERSTTIMTTQRLILKLVMACLGSALLAAATVATTSITNANAVDELRRDGSRHSSEGHPNLRSEVVEVRTEVRGLTASIDALSENIEGYRQSNENLMDRRGSARHRSSRSNRSSSSR